MILCLDQMYHGFDDTNTSMINQKTNSKGIFIGDDVWMGANSIILDGVTIASHCIIGGGSDYKRHSRVVVIQQKLLKKDLIRKKIFVFFYIINRAKFQYLSFPNY
ncbi:MAG: hypothetical protein PHF17_06520 [Arcobacteraceae bacterium]|nr:hypothetical protein [Arcobacteraceae bacterium]